MQFELFSVGRNQFGDWWVNAVMFKWGIWEPALLRLHRLNYGKKVEWDILGIGELRYWWKRRRYE